MPYATMTTSAGSYTVDATAPVPGLRVYQAPAHVSPQSPYRWILAHWEGVALASFESGEAATRAAEAVAPLADWTRSGMTAANEISCGGHVAQLGHLLREAGGQHPNA
jgi:hypothetical protein